MNSVSDRILRIRGLKPQSEFANDLNVNPNTLRAYEKGRALPSFEFLTNLCEKFSVSPAWILTGIGEMHAKGNSGTDSPPINKQIDVMYCENCKELQGKIIELQNKIIELQDDYMQLMKNSMAKK